MRHCATLSCATLPCAALMLTALAGATLAEPFADAAPWHQRPLVSLSSPAISSGAAASGANIRIAQAGEAPSADPETSDKEDCAGDAENTEERIANCSRVIADDTADAAKRAQAYRRLGDIYYRKSDYDQAIADFSEAMKLDPSVVPASFAPAYNRRGVADAEQKGYDSAIADYSEAIKLDASSAEVYKNRGSVYNIKKDYDRAIADFDQAIKLDPSYAVAYNDRGFAYFGKSDLDRAIQDYSEAVRSNPRYALGYSNRGFAYAKKNDLDHAIPDYNEAIRLNPRLARPYRNRCNAYYAMKNYDAAITDCTEAARLDPKDEFARTTLGLATTAKSELEAVGGSEEVFRLQANKVLKLSVVVNGVQGTFIMDTGATFVSMKRAFADKAKVQIDQASGVKIHTANGDVEGKRGRAATVQLRSLQAKDVVVMVQSGSQSPYGDGVDGLLGLSFLSRFKVSIDAQTVKIAGKGK